MEQIRQAEVYGVRPPRTFRQAAIKYLNESTKATLRDAAIMLKQLNPFIGDLVLDKINMGTLQPFIQKRKSDGVKKRTINYALQTVRHILNLATSEWFDEYGQTWLGSAPKIKLLKEDDKRDPYPLSWDEQVRLFNALPEYLSKMALFKVNTGCREQEVCQLRWDWEQYIPELDTSVFIVPRERVKNREDRLVVLNRVAKAVIEEKRGQHPEFVFTNTKDEQVKYMNGGCWRRAREKVNLSQVRVHDLKHTFGRRLRAAGVSFEDRQDLLGHRSGRITTHYSMPELENLIAAANAVCRSESRKSPALVILRKKAV
jgi:integrase